LFSRAWFIWRTGCVKSVSEKICHKNGIGRFPTEAEVQEIVKDVRRFQIASIVSRSVSQIFDSGSKIIGLIFASL
jgi:hypothetical protein